MTKLHDLTGQSFGRLTVIEKEPSRQGKKVRWKCRCACGNVAFVQAGNLLTAHTISCGCYSEQVRSTISMKHGMRGSPEYVSWFNMKQRCKNPNNDKFPYYGARGIQVCERWLSFENFYADMGRKPSSAYTIERKDNNGNYEPTNCVWATRAQQTKNRRQWGTAL